MNSSVDASGLYSLEQLDRVKRWHQRLSRIDQGVKFSLSADIYLDDILAFFLNCYHLKDWIKNDKSFGAAADKVEEFIDNNEELRMCADICNSTKHLVLTRQPRSDQKPRFRLQHFHVKLRGAHTTISIKYSIATSRGPVDAFDFATKCLRAWEKFIEENINKPLRE